MNQIVKLENDMQAQIQQLSNTLVQKNFKTMDIQQKCFPPDPDLPRNYPGNVKTCLSLPQTYAYQQVSEQCPDLALNYVDNRGGLSKTNYCDRRNVLKFTNYGEPDMVFCPNKPMDSSEQIKAFQACQKQLPVPFPSSYDFTINSL